MNTHKSQLAASCRSTACHYVAPIFASQFIEPIKTKLFWWVFNTPRRHALRPFTPRRGATRFSTTLRDAPYLGAVHRFDSPSRHTCPGGDLLRHFAPHNSARHCSAQHHASHPVAPRLGSPYRFSKHHNAPSPTLSESSGWAFIVSHVSASLHDTALLRSPPRHASQRCLSHRYAALRDFMHFDA